jgi:hypothetical protein
VESKRHHRKSDLGGRLMWTLLAAVAIIVVAVLYFYGFRDPSQGPGNVPGAVSASNTESRPPPASK